MDESLKMRRRVRDEGLRIVNLFYWGGMLQGEQSFNLTVPDE